MGVVIPCWRRSQLSPPSNHPSFNIHFILTIQISTLANGQWRLDNMWVRQTNQHMLFTGKYRCLSKEIGVGVAIPLLAEESIETEVEVRFSSFSYSVPSTD